MKKSRLLFPVLLLASFFLPYSTAAGQAHDTDVPLLEAVPDSLAEFYDYAQSDSVLRLAVVLSDIYSKKDMEFTRGLLMGLGKAGLPTQSISLKVVNGEIPADSLQYELELFGPHVLVSTFEKDAPVGIGSYAYSNDCYILNAFDARGDDYKYNGNVIQVLAPSDVFNSNSTRYLIDNFAGNVLVIIGDPDPTDTSMRDLLLSWPEEELMILTMDDMEIFSLDEGVNYIFYPLLSSADEVKKVLSESVRLLAETPSAGLRIFGRPNWIAINDLNSMIANMEVYLPAKCYFDPSSDQSKRFIANYNSTYGHAPIRSYPVFAVMGYDIARYFLPRFIEALHGGNFILEPGEMNQSYFNFGQLDTGGYFNRGTFILHYEPWGTLSKETID